MISHFKDTTKTETEGVRVLKQIHIVRKLSQPRKPRKKEKEAWAIIHKRKVMPILYHESVERMVDLWAYCCQDVLAEEALSERLPDLSPAEQDIYSLDQDINERGFQLDAPAVKAALALVRTETKALNQELSKLTKGKVKRATQRARLKAWFDKQEDWVLQDTQAATITALLDMDKGWTPEGKRALEILQELGRSSTAKYETMQNWMSPRDARVRGSLLYHGATTGRWTGAGVQPHNFVKGKINSNEKMEDVWNLLLSGSRTTLIEKYPNVMETLSYALRGTIIPSKGKQLYVADFAGIEARVLLWLANDQKGLDIFREGRDIYCEMASAIYHRTITKIDSQERQLGKATILGAGFGMGWSRFISTALTYGVVIEDDFSKVVIDTYREKFWKAKQLWYDMENAAILATSTKTGKAVNCNLVTWVKEDIFLYCILPSGRKLSYPFPEIRAKETPWGEMKRVLTFMSVDKHFKWTRQHTYGGSLVENIVQAIARDLMAEAMLRCEESKIYSPVLSVHDEAICEAHPSLGNVHEFGQLVAENPVWAKGLPIEAEAWAGTRYRK